MVGRLAAILMVLSVHAAPAETIGGLRVQPVTPAGLVTVSALDETGCRVPMLVWRFQGGALTLIYAFDMEVDPEQAAGLRLWAERGGAPLSDPAAWPLTASHRNATVPEGTATALLRAARDGAEVLLRLEDPASGSELHDRFALTEVTAALAALPCAPD